MLDSFASVSASVSGFDWRLTENGVMEPDRLYESPFSEIAPHGPESLFPSGDVDRMITILRTVRANAAPERQVA